ncbi:hypothetical protein KP509_19G045400 [Ceratopteris richardii]|uniref:Plant bHLH transcription factor ACT-like domain-containing protein n=1 Tax=Ceratopteris richardii TaxID=49495 RepID=A0A8T2SNK2_CERRI|nr:hypothetical protein KP509_19G045400 [Ceratopteris richardii]
MAVSEKLPPYEPSPDSTDSSSSLSSSHMDLSSDGESSSSCSSSVYNECNDSVLHCAGKEAEDKGEDQEETVPLSSGYMPPARLTPPSLRVSVARCKGASTSRLMSDVDAVDIQRLRYHLASLRSLLPPLARSSQPGNVIRDALKYKKALAKELDVLQNAVPYARQVNVKQSGTGCLKVGISCDKKPGLLIALMEALDRSGLTFTSVNLSCLNDKVEINAVSTKGVKRSPASVKVALLSTIMHFSSQLQ